MVISIATLRIADDPDRDMAGSDELGVFGSLECREVVDDKPKRRGPSDDIAPGGPDGAKGLQQMIGPDHAPPWRAGPGVVIGLPKVRPEYLKYEITDGEGREIELRIYHRIDDARAMPADVRIGGPEFGIDPGEPDLASGRRD